MLSARHKRTLQYREIIEEAKLKGQLAGALRRLCLKDLWFLLSRILNQKHMMQGPEYKQDWLFERCMEVQLEPDGCLDVWAREHFKSTIISFGKTIQDILEDPEQTFCFLSYNNKSAQKFSGVIKREFEINRTLKNLWPDVLYKEPKKEAPKWSEIHGFTVRRKGNPKEATVEAYGLIDGMPTGGHYDVLVYEDIVTEDTVRTAGMMERVDRAFDLSLSLGKDGGKRRIIGTFYHFADKYVKISQAGTTKVRMYPATDDGTVTGRPVLLTPEALEDKRVNTASYVFACQQLLNPKAEGNAGFSDEWLRHFERIPRVLNIYILADPASGRNKQKAKSDFTNFDVIGLGVDDMYYWLDSIRDKLGLHERAMALLGLYRKWKTQVSRDVNWTIKRIGYEEYGLQADIEHIEYVQEQEGFHLPQGLIKPLGGNQVSKQNRIEWLVPIFEHGRFLMPHKILRRNYQGIMENIVETFIEKEYKLWPFPEHDDGLDCKARIKDPELKAEFPEDIPPGVLSDPGRADRERNEWDPMRY